jgi:hypothetical protein
MKTLKIIGLSAVISILSLSAQADSFNLVIKQVANTDSTYMNQSVGRNNTQAMNAVELKHNKTSVVQIAKSDRLSLSQANGYNNLQAANTVDAYNAKGRIYQSADIDAVNMLQRYGTSNTQALNHVKAVR